MMAQVLSPARRAPRSPLAQAAREGDLSEIRRLLAAGQDPDDGGAGASPLWEACLSKAPQAERLAVAEALLEAGANPRLGAGGERPLHAVARRGPVALAERLIRHGAIEWEPDGKGRSPLDVARRCRGADRAAMIALLDRPVIGDPSFRAAVDAIHAGDVARLERLIDAEPRLLTDCIREPDCYRLSGRSQYFLDPRLFWFVANNPILIARPPANLPQVARTMIARGVAQADLDYALELAMTGSSLREHGMQIPMAQVLVEAGARVAPEAMGSVLGHGETAVVEHLVAAGMAMTAPIAAALGRLDVLPDLLRSASRAQVDEALDLAVINNRPAGVKLVLEAGANPDRFSSQHRHSQPLHQATLHDSVEMARMLVAHGARLDAVDTLWNGTPLGWARHAGAKALTAWLEARG